LPFSLMVMQIQAHNVESFSCCGSCRTGFIGHSPLVCRFAERRQERRPSAAAFTR
jgi:hypothetical protein